MKQTIIFDFDDTIFNTVLFKKDSLSLIAIQAKLNLRTCVKHFLFFSQKQKIYTWQSFVDYLAQKEKIDTFDTSFLYNKDLQKYVSKSDKNILKNLSKTYNLVLLTQGNKKNQRLKINNSQVDNLFSHIYIVENSKKDFLLRHKSLQKSIFINDKEKENKELSILFPYLRIYHFVGYVISQTPKNCTPLFCLKDIKKLERFFVLAKC